MAPNLDACNRILDELLEEKSIKEYELPEVGDLPRRDGSTVRCKELD